MPCSPLPGSMKASLRQSFSTVSFLSSLRSSTSPCRTGCTARFHGFNKEEPDPGPGALRFQKASRTDRSRQYSRLASRVLFLDANPWKTGPSGPSPPTPDRGGAPARQDEKERRERRGRAEKRGWPRVGGPAAWPAFAPRRSCSTPEVGGRCLDGAVRKPCRAAEEALRLHRTSLFEAKR